MVVTFPLVLLLFDLWPLRRPFGRRTILEKLPLLGVAAASSVVTYYVQRSAGALQAMALPLRIENALVSCLVYLGQMFWPTRLAVFYPFPDSIPFWQPILAFLLIAVISILAIRTWRTRPYLAAGWFWYLVMLIPVIGLVQVGSQAHADRYAYLPMVGLLIVVAAGAAEFSGSVMLPQSLVVPGLLIIACCVQSFREAKHWQNSETLFQHALDVTTNNWIAEGNLGAYLMTQPDRRGDAVDHLRAALRIHPAEPEANNNLGLILAQAGLCQEAIPHFQAALRTRPGFPKALNNLATCYMTSGRYAEAVPYLQAALQSAPQSPDIRLNLGMTLANIPGREAEAAAEYQAALRVNPNLFSAHYAYGLLLAKLGRTAEAISQFEAANLIQPDPRVDQFIRQLRAR
jgi:Tfp pilus assembly protein PilF